MLAVITSFILSTGSEEAAAAARSGALGPHTEPYTYKIDLGVMHQIGKLVPAKLNLPEIT